MQCFLLNPLLGSDFYSYSILQLNSHENETSLMGSDVEHAKLSFK